MSRGDQLARQWRIVQAMATRKGGVSVGELAGEENCSPRTIYRDLEALQYAGFPIMTEKEDQKTFWKFVDGYRHNIPVQFSIDELMAMHYSRGMSRVFKGTIFYDPLESLFKKIRSSLPPETLNLVDRFENVFEYGQRPRKEYSQFREIIAQVNKACSEHRQIDMRYYTLSRDAVNTRRVSPYRVWYFEGSLYLIAYCHWRKKVLMFALDRIRLVTLTEETFVMPSDFSVDKYMANCFKLIHDELVQVKVRFSGHAARWVMDKEWHPSQEITKSRDGTITASYHVGGTSEIKRWILSFGPMAEVLEPESLRNEIAQEVARIADLYAKKEARPARSRKT
jgi:predicted DNA-binding transcriptional regulator YafY